MKLIKAIIVEDSRLARNELKSLVGPHPEIEIVGEAENVEQALKQISELQPDLLFLDIHMPEQNGFDLLEALEVIPTVIFTTAYDEYAVKSFEYNAFDYLLKPISQERFAKAIKKVLADRDQTGPIDSKPTLQNKLFIKDGERCWMVNLSEISLFEVDGNYTKVFWEDQHPMVYKSLNQIEKQMDPQVFFRANRQQLINLEHITKVDPYFNASLKIQLKNNLEVEVSRRQSVKLKEQFGL